MFNQVFVHLLTRDRCPLVCSWFEEYFGECLHATTQEKGLYLVYFGSERESKSVSSRGLYDIMVKSESKSAFGALWSCASFYDDNWELDHKLHGFVEGELDTRDYLRAPFAIHNLNLTLLLPWCKPIPESTKTVKVRKDTDESIAIEISLDCPPVMTIIAEDLWRKQL